MLSKSDMEDLKKMRNANIPSDREMLEQIMNMIQRRELVATNRKAEKYLRYCMAMIERKH